MTAILDETATSDKATALDAGRVPGSEMAQRLLEAASDHKPEPAPDGAARAGRPRRRWIRWLQRIMTLVMLGVFVLVGTTVIGEAAGWWRLDVVLSGSMRPTFAPGDLLILKPEPLRDVRVGQIVAFVPPGRNYVETHRVIEVQRVKGETIVRTKGDANNVADPWHAVLDPPKVWYVDHVIPHAGFLTEWAKSKGARIAVIALVVGLFLVYALGRIWRRRDPPSEEEEPADVPELETVGR
jgi:signal peptidase I